MKNRMKLTALAALAVPTVMAQAQDVQVTVDGRPVKFEGTEAQYRQGRVLVPLRGVFEEMGAEVRWNPSNRTVTAERDGRVVRLVIGDRTASIDGAPVMMDVPAQVVMGSTMVPIRFLSESLGADVGWNSSQRLVSIITDPSATPKPNKPKDSEPALQREVIAEDTVLPVELDTPLSSNESRRGDKFTATLQTKQDTYYGVLPAGTRIEGHVASVRSKQGKDPGVLDLDFDRIRLPDGRAYDFDGELISLDADTVKADEQGILRAPAGTKDNRTVYAGYGAGAGLVVGLLTKKPLEGGLIGGLLGYLAGEAEKSQSKPADVQLKRGTEFGVRLTEALAIRL